MLMVRLDNVLEDIIRRDCETCYAEITNPVLEKLALVERKVDTELFAKLGDDEGNEKQRKVSNTIKHVCLEAIETVPQHSGICIRKVYKVDAILSLHDPFESFIKQAVEHSMREKTKPIMEILKILEEKVEEYGRHGIPSSYVTSVANGDNYKSLPWQEGEMTKQSGTDVAKDAENEREPGDIEQRRDELVNDDERNEGKSVGTTQNRNERLNARENSVKKLVHIKHSRRDEPAKLEETNKMEAVEILKRGEDRHDRPLVVPVKGAKHGMIVRITSWRYNTKTHPEEDKIYLDLTKKRIDLLVEGIDS